MVNILLFVILEFWLTDDTCTVKINVFNQGPNARVNQGPNAREAVMRGMI